MRRTLSSRFNLGDSELTIGNVGNAYRQFFLRTSIPSQLESRFQGSISSTPQHTRIHASKLDAARNEVGRVFISSILTESGHLLGFFKPIKLLDHSISQSFGEVVHPSIPRRPRQIPRYEHSPPVKMSLDEDGRPGVVSVTTGGIQDVSALLPLLGTEQCEELVTTALQDGSLYAASTPMSIFGSLGIVKAGFIVLWASMDFPAFPGPKYLRNARITPTGVGKLLAHVGDDPQRLYVAEDEIRRHLSKFKINSFHINFASSGLLWWNTRLVVHTALLSGLGLLPYVYIIKTSLQDAPFRTTWLYPLMRVVGCGMVAISMQFIFQFRILEEVSCRLSFLAVDNRLKDEHLPVPSYWDSNRRSKTVLSRLRGRDKVDRDDTTRHLVFTKMSEIASVSFPILGKFSQKEQENMDSTSATKGEVTVVEEEGAGGSEKGEAVVVKAEEAGKLEKGETVTSESSVSSFLRRHGSHYFTTIFLWVARAFLLFGLGISVVGYIGSFSVVQASPRSDSKGSLIWLLSEAALSIIRAVVWASNPRWDDAQPPIVLEKTTGGKKNSYGVGWSLESVTANDVHALIVGIDDGQTAPTNAQKVEDFLQDDLLVPKGQIVTLENEKATKEGIMDALNALSHRVSVTDDSAICIYFETESFVEAGTTYLIPYRQKKPGGESEGAQKESSISYTTIVEILQQIARDKTDNITVILECPYADDTQSDSGEELKKNGERRIGWGPIGNSIEEAFVGDTSHILLARRLSKCKSGGHFPGAFTEALLRVLKDEKSDYARLLPTMRYKDLVKFMNGKVPRPPRSHLAHMRDTIKEKCGCKAESPPVEDTGANAFCTTFYQNRLLFNGLFSRRVITSKVDPLVTVSYSDIESKPDVETRHGPESKDNPESEKS